MDEIHSASDAAATDGSAPSGEVGSDAALPVPLGRLLPVLLRKVDDEADEEEEDDGGGSAEGSVADDAGAEGDEVEGLPDDSGQDVGLPDSSAADDDKSALQLRGLPFGATIAQVKDFLGKHAENLILSGPAIRILVNSQNRPSGFARVQFCSQEAARLCREQRHKQKLGDRYVEVLVPCREKSGKVRSQRSATGDLDKSGRNSREDISNPATTDRVLQEIRNLMQGPGKHDQLMSMLGHAVSQASRACLRGANIGLKQFLLRNSDEFRLEGGGGSERMIWIPGAEQAGIDAPDTGQEPADATILRLRGLPFTATVEEVSLFFEEHDVAYLVSDSPDAVQFINEANGGPSGEAMVQMKSIEDAEAAQHALHNKDLQGYFIEVFFFGEKHDANIDQGSAVPEAMDVSGVMDPSDGGAEGEDAETGDADFSFPEGSNGNEDVGQALDANAAAGKRQGGDMRPPGSSGKPSLWLSHAGRGLTDEDVEKMAFDEESYRFNKVDFSQNAISVDGLWQLLHLCEKCPPLAVLNLSENKIGDDGAAVLAEIVTSCSSLRELHLSQNLLTREGVQTLVEAAERRDEDCAHPLWLCVDGNDIADQAELLQEMEESFGVCPQQEGCSKTTCSVGSKIHLPYLNMELEEVERQKAELKNAEDAIAERENAERKRAEGKSGVGGGKVKGGAHKPRPEAQAKSHAHRSGGPDDRRRSSDQELARPRPGMRGKDAQRGAEEGKRMADDGKKRSRSGAKQSKHPKWSWEKSPSRSRDGKSQRHHRQSREDRDGDRERGDREDRNGDRGRGDRSRRDHDRGREHRRDSGDGEKDHRRGDSHRDGEKDHRRGGSHRGGDSHRDGRSRSRTRREGRSSAKSSGRSIQERLDERARAVAQGERPVPAAVAPRSVSSRANGGSSKAPAAPPGDWSGHGPAVAEPQGSLQERLSSLMGHLLK